MINTSLSYHFVKRRRWNVMWSDSSRVCVCVCVYVWKYHNGKSRNLAWPGKPRSSVETVAIRAVGPCRRVAGWLAFPGAPTPAWPPPPAEAGRPHGLLLAGLKKLRKTHENDDSNFPKTVVKTVTGWKNSTSSPPPHSNGLYIDVWFVLYYCYYYYHNGRPPPPSTHTAGASSATPGNRRRRLIPWYNRSHFFSQVWPAETTHIVTRHEHLEQLDGNARGGAALLFGITRLLLTRILLPLVCVCVCVYLPLIILMHILRAAVINCCRYHRRIAKQFVNRHTIQITRCFLEKQHAALEGKLTAV